MKQEQTTTENTEFLVIISVTQKISSNHPAHPYLLLGESLISQAVRHKGRSPHMPDLRDNGAGCGAVDRPADNKHKSNRVRVVTGVSQREKYTHPDGRHQQTSERPISAPVISLQLTYSTANLSLTQAFT